MNGPVKILISTKDHKTIKSKMEHFETEAIVHVEFLLTDDWAKMVMEVNKRSDFRIILCLCNDDLKWDNPFDLLTLGLNNVVVFAKDSIHVPTVVYFDTIDEIIAAAPEAAELWYLNDSHPNDLRKLFGFRPPVVKIDMR